jgi:hypothetical protein
MTDDTPDIPETSLRKEENSTYVCRALMAKVSPKGKESMSESSVSDFYDEEDGVVYDSHYQACDGACQEVYDLTRRLSDLHTRFENLKRELAQVTDDREEAYLMVDVLTEELAKLKGENDFLKSQSSLRISHHGSASRTSTSRPTPGSPHHYRHVRKPLPIAKVTGISEDLLCRLLDETLHDVMRRHGRTVPKSYMRRHLSTPSYT